MLRDQGVSVAGPAPPAGVRLGRAADLSGGAAAHLPLATWGSTKPRRPKARPVPKFDEVVAAQPADATVLRPIPVSSLAHRQGSQDVTDRRHGKSAPARPRSPLPGHRPAAPAQPDSKQVPSPKQRPKRGAAAASASEPGHNGSTPRRRQPVTPKRGAADASAACTPEPQGDVGTPRRKQPVTPKRAAPSARAAAASAGKQMTPVATPPRTPSNARTRAAAAGTKAASTTPPPRRSRLDTTAGTVVSSPYGVRTRTGKGPQWSTPLADVQGANGTPPRRSTCTGAGEWCCGSPPASVRCRNRWRADLAPCL